MLKRQVVRRMRRAAMIVAVAAPLGLTAPIAAASPTVIQGVTATPRADVDPRCAEETRNGEGAIRILHSCNECIAKKEYYDRLGNGETYVCKHDVSSGTFWLQTR